MKKHLFPLAAALALVISLTCACAPASPPMPSVVSAPVTPESPEIGATPANNLTTYDPTIFNQPMEPAFQNENLMQKEFPLFDMSKVGTIVQTIDLGGVTQVMYHRPGNDQLYSYLEVGGKDYDLNLYPDSPYDAGPITETGIQEQYAVIYAYDIGLGADYFQRQYFYITNGIPYLVAQIDNASEADIDGDGSIETTSSHGLPMNTTLYLWDLAERMVSYADLNAALNSASVVFDDSNHVFIAAYYDTATTAPINISLKYSNGTLSVQK